MENLRCPYCGQNMPKEYYPRCFRDNEVYYQCVCGRILIKEK